jgi:uncharacterized protein (TIGR00251 family)
MARRISVTVQPNSKSVTITKLNEREYRATVREPARDGKANLAVIELIARYFAVPKSRITIIRGHTSRRKIIELAES